MWEIFSDCIVNNDAIIYSTPIPSDSLPVLCLFFPRTRVHIVHLNGNVWEERDAVLLLGN